MFLTRAEEKGDAPFLWAKREGEWRSISWREAARQVAALAASLKRMGLHKGDRVCLVSENRPEWLIADLGIMAAGCVTVPTYTTNTSRDHTHILENSGARAVIVSTQKLTRNLAPGRAHFARLPALHRDRRNDADSGPRRYAGPLLARPDRGAGRRRGTRSASCRVSAATTSPA